MTFSITAVLGMNAVNEIRPTIEDAAACAEDLYAKGCDNIRVCGGDRAWGLKQLRSHLNPNRVRRPSANPSKPAGGG